MSQELDLLSHANARLNQEKSKILFTSQWQVSRRSQLTPVYEPSQELDARRQLPLPDAQGPQTHQRRFINLYRTTQVSGKIAAETGGFRRRFKPPFSQDAKPSHPARHGP
jgi:hypothetical protein